VTSMLQAVMPRAIAVLFVVTAVASPASALGVEKIDVLEPVADGAGLLAPTALGRDALRDTLVVADTEGDRVLLLDRQGGVRKVLGREGGLRRPVAVAVSRQGVLYVAERKRENLQTLVAYDSADPEEFVSLDLSPHRGAKAVEPVALHVDARGRLYVVDRANRQLLVLAPDGSLTLRLTRVGKPVDVWADGQRILLADPAFGRIQVYDAQGKWRRSVGDSPSRAALPLRPISISVDRHERIWVVEEDGGIQVLDPIGNRLLSVPGDDLFDPSDALIDLEGTFWVLERGGNRIAVFAVREF